MSYFWSPGVFFVVKQRRCQHLARHLFFNRHLRCQIQTKIGNAVARAVLANIGNIEWVLRWTKWSVFKDSFQLLVEQSIAIMWLSYHIKTLQYENVRYIKEMIDIVYWQNLTSVKKTNAEKWWRLGINFIMQKWTIAAFNFPFWDGQLSWTSIHLVQRCSNALIPLEKNLCGWSSKPVVYCCHHWS